METIINEQVTRVKRFKSSKDLVIHIYWQHDLDLATLCYYKDFSVSYWMKQALIAYVRKDNSFSIPLPEEQPIAIEHKNKHAHFILNEETEADVIEFVQSFRYGFRNNGIKQIMRSYLADHFLNVYTCNSLYTIKPAVPKSKEHIFKRKQRFDYSKAAFPAEQADTDNRKDILP